MNRQSTRSFSANEKEIERLLKENSHWREILKYLAAESHFFFRLLEADIYQSNLPNLYDNLKNFYDELESMRIYNIDASREVHNHRYDIEGILECEDISCEVFYHDEHLELGKKILEFERKFKQFALRYFDFMEKHLKNSDSDS